MRVQGIGVSFGNGNKKSKPSIIGSTLTGAAIGAVGGFAAKNLAPASNDFFEKNTSTEDSKTQIRKSVTDFIENYGKQEVEEVRILKTALKELNLGSELAKNKIVIKRDLKNQSINDLLKDNSIQLIGKEDSKELKNSVAELKKDLIEEINKPPKEKQLERVENLSKSVGELKSEAKNAMKVKKDLIHHTENIKGLNTSGTLNIKQIKDAINKKLTEAEESAKPVIKQLSDSFNTMVKSTAKTQRKNPLWIGIPTIGMASITGSIAVGKRTKD